MSDPLHMKRAMALCEKNGINGLPSPTQTSMYQTLNSKASSLLYESFFYMAELVFGHI